MDKTRKFFKDVGFYLSSNFLANILNFITGIVVRRILQPALMGLFNEVMLIFDYARYSHLGVIDALDREMPYFYGMKDYKKVERLKDIGFTLCLIITLLVSLSILISSFFVRFSNDKILVNGIRIVSIMVILRLLNSLYIVLNRSRNRFSIISKNTLLVAVFDLIIKIGLTIRFGLYGLLWGCVLTLVLGVFYFYKASEEKFKFVLGFPFREWISLFKIGFPIFIIGLVSMTLMNIDRLMIIRLLNREDLGVYTIALMVNVYMLQLPNLIYAVFFPRFYQAYGEKQNIFDIKELFVKPTVVFAYLFPIFIGLTILILPLLLQYILPAYMPGLIPTYFLLFGTAFMVLVNMPGYLFIALNKQIYMIIIGSICICAGVALNYLFVKKFNFGLSGIAMGTSLTYFLYATIMITCAVKNYTKKVFSHINFFTELYFPIFWVALLLGGLQVFVFKCTGDIFKDMLIIFCKAIVFLLGSIPLIFYINRKTALLTLLRKTYFEKR